MTGIPLLGKVVDLSQLQAEMLVAGIPAILGSDGVTVFTYDAGGSPAELPGGAVAVLAAHVPSTTLHDALVTALTSSVGVSIAALSQAQRLALVAGLLYKAGAIDRSTLVIKPLSTWLT